MNGQCQRTVAEREGEREREPHSRACQNTSKNINCSPRLLLLVLSVSQGVNRHKITALTSPPPLRRLKYLPSSSQYRGPLRLLSLQHLLHVLGCLLLQPLQVTRCAQCRPRDPTIYSLLCQMPCIQGTRQHHQALWSPACTAHKQEPAANATAQHALLCHMAYLQHLHRPHHPWSPAVLTCQ